MYFSWYFNCLVHLCIICVNLHIFLTAITNLMWPFLTLLPFSSNSLIIHERVFVSYFFFHLNIIPVSSDYSFALQTNPQSRLTAFLILPVVLKPRASVSLSSEPFTNPPQSLPTSVNLQDSGGGSNDALYCPPSLWPFQHPCPFPS